MKLVVTNLNLIAKNILKIRFKSYTPSALPEFKPGAHVCLRVGPEGLERKYSLISSPLDLSYYEVAVLKVTGGVSEWLHEHLKIGDEIQALRVVNEFSLNNENTLNELTRKHSILIAGGIGITPIFAFAQELTRTKASFELHYTAKSIEAMALKSELEQICDQQAKFYFDSEGTTSLNVAMVVKPYHPSQHIYICGPRSLIESVKKECLRKGWPTRSIHFETFGATISKSSCEFEVELALTGTKIKVSADQSILDVAEKAGAWVSYECKRGECGKCCVEYAGEVEHRDVCLTDEARKTLMCICVSRPKGSNLVIQI